MFPEIKDLIPQRAPFLFIDKITAFEDKKISTSLALTGQEDFFKGHFPGNPIMPGVLLQEALFQSGAALMALKNKEGSRLGVVTRVQNAKFKSMVRPGDTLEMEVELTDSISNASYMKGSTRVNGKVVLVIEFAVASI
ncbi:MAG: 3-hydroxyacyl-ACP dehydratase FabZ [Bacteriovorax sp.]|nr:3-hydroxyacyl-ACP dehydratase FabZ [Bacteriovorax sp.]